MTDAIHQTAPAVHIRFEGQSWDIPLSELDLGNLSDDAAVRATVANYLNIDVAKLRFYVVERHTNGNLTIRPEAVFG